MSKTQQAFPCEAKKLKYKGKEQYRVRCQLVLVDDSDKFFIRLSERRPGYEGIEKDFFRLKKTKFTENHEQNSFSIRTDGLEMECSRDFEDLLYVMKYKVGTRPSVSSTSLMSTRPSPAFNNNDNNSFGNVNRTKMNPLMVEKKSGEVHRKTLIPRPEVRNASPMKLPSSAAKPIAATSPLKTSPGSSTYHTTYSKSPVISRARAGSDEYSHWDGKFRDATPEKVLARNGSPNGKQIPGIASSLFANNSPSKPQLSIRTYGTKPSLTFAPKFSASVGDNSKSLFDNTFGTSKLSGHTTTPPRKHARMDEVGNRVSVATMLSENEDRFHAGDSILVGHAHVEKTLPSKSFNAFSKMLTKNPFPPPPPISFDDEENEDGDPAKSSLPPMPTKGMTSVGSFFNKTQPFGSSVGTSNFSTINTLATTTSNTNLLTKPSILKGGIRNLGNTCYMSSILQALFALHPTMEHFDAPFWSSLVSSDDHNEKVEVDLNETENKLEKPFSTTNEEFQAQKQVKSLLGEFQSLSRQQMLIRGEYNIPNPYNTSFKVLGDETILDLRRMKKLMGSINNIFSGFAQQDAHEFWTSLMTHLEEEMKHRATLLLTQPVSAGNFEEEKKTNFLSPSSVSIMPNSAVKAPPSPSSDTRVELDKEQLKNTLDALNMVLPPVYDFESVMSMRMRCQRCQYTHPVRHEKYRDFSLDLPEKISESSSSAMMKDNEESSSSVAMEDLIRTFLQHETRELKCPHCTGGNEVRIHKEITSLPPVLILHLKRFTYSMHSNAMMKSSQAIAFQPVLDLKKCGFMMKNDPRKQEKVCKASFDFVSQYQSLCNRSVQKLSDKDRMLQHMESMQALYFDMERCIKTSPMSTQMLIDDAQEQDKAQAKDVEEYCYQLKAVVRHLGVTLESGHYVCDIFDSNFVNNDKPDQVGHWIRCNDHMLSPIDEDLVLKDMDTPYIFFYQLVKKTSADV